MVHDSGPGVGGDTFPLASTVAALHAAMAAYARGWPNAEIRPALHLLAEDARMHDVRVEHAIILLKNLWRALPEVQQMADRTKHYRLLSRLVSLFIFEYFGY